MSVPFQRFRSDREAVPQFEIIDLSIFFTSICNSGCLTCDIWKTKERVEFPYATVEALAALPLLQQVTWVLLGGEFTIYSRYVDVVRLLHDKGIPYVVLTNGILPEKIYKLYEAVPVKSLSISLDALGSRHDEIRGYPGNFKRVVELLDWVQEKHPETFLRVCYTVSGCNTRADLEQVKAFTEQRGIDLKLGVAAAAAIYTAHSPAMLTLAEPECYPFEDLFPNDKYLQLYRPWKRGWKPLCEGILHHPVIMQDGRLIVCQNLGISLGNVCETPFETLWQSTAVRARLLQYSKECNACWMTCERKYDAERVPWESIQALRQFMEVTL